MEYLNGLSNMSDSILLGKPAPLPPRSPFQSIPPSHSEYITSSAIVSDCFLKPVQGHARHQRASSDSLLIEEQPSWLDELLSEPETPVYNGHRRSSSDSVAFLDAATKPFLREGTASLYAAGPSWVSDNFDHQERPWHASLNNTRSPFSIQQERAWETSLRNGIILQNSGLPSNLQKQGAMPSKPMAKQVRESKSGSSVKKDCSQGNPASRNESRRAKQQVAHRSRVRRLQYIAELERNVHILQTEGTEVSAELQYLDQQNLILSMENRALQQRLDSLSQLQQLKHMEQDMLEKELGRLQFLYCQQQQQLQQQQRQKHSTRGQSESRELDSQFANLAI